MIQPEELVLGKKKFSWTFDQEQFSYNSLCDQLPIL